MVRATLVVVLMAVVGLLLSPASPACACSCQGFTEQEAFDEADVVFAGTVVDIDEPWPSMSSGDPVTVTFLVSDVYKAGVPANVGVTTSRDGASCGYAFSVGTRYLVFAHRDGTAWRTGLCSGNRVVDAATPAPTGGYSAGPAKPEAGWPVLAWVGVAVGAVVVLVGLGLWWRRAARRN